MINRILIINIFGIGDVLFTTPMLKNIRDNIPDAFIGYVCNKRALPVLENNPQISRLHIYEKDDFRALAGQSRIKCLEAFLRFILDIKREKYDLVFDLSLHKHSSLLLWLIGIKERVGFNYKNRSPFLTTKVNINGYENKHVVEHYLSLLQLKGFRITSSPLEVFVKGPDRQDADVLLERKKIKPDDLLVGLVPGGGASWGRDARYRRWPAEKHAQLADKIIEKYRAKVILLGDSSEEELGRNLQLEMRQRAVNLIGQTTLGTYLALLKRCALVVVNDGGPLHMAVAAGAHTVSLIGPVDENVYGPYPKAGHAIVTRNIACRPCYRNFRRADCEHVQCINSVSVADFFQAVEQAMTSIKTRSNV